MRSAFRREHLSTPPHTPVLYKSSRAHCACVRFTYLHSRASAGHFSSCTRDISGTLGCLDVVGSRGCASCGPQPCGIRVRAQGEPVSRFGSAGALACASESMCCVLPQLRVGRAGCEPQLRSEGRESARRPCGSAQPAVPGPWVRVRTLWGIGACAAPIWWATRAVPLCRALRTAIMRETVDCHHGSQCRVRR